MNLLMKRLQLPAKPRKNDVAGIGDMPPLPDMSYDENDVADESDDWSDLGGTEGKPPISLKQTAFSLKKFAKTMGQANYSPFNKWKKVWVAESLQKKHPSIIQG
jgi:hypothetical protein